MKIKNKNNGNTLPIALAVSSLTAVLQFFDESLPSYSSISALEKCLRTFCNKIMKYYNTYNTT